jgi:aminoglycoside/choline kinase family phosphotransferase
MITETNLKMLFEEWTKDELNNITPLPKSGSNRKYFRLTGEEKNAIGVFNRDKRENEAFIYLTKHFIAKGLNVPSLYDQDIENSCYLIQDLGDETFYSKIESVNNEKQFPDELIATYKKSLNRLISFQIDGGKDLDYSVCNPRPEFDKQSIMWDLNYFKYYFLRLSNTQFDEQKLEGDFNTLVHFLLQADSNYFMYRDFQSRNIMLYNDDLYFIDYQGGRKGALQYDVASLLFQAKVNLTPKLREQLLGYYLDRLNEKIQVNKEDFIKYYYEFVLLRILQTLGAYGYRGYFERKSHFISSIPFAIKNLKLLIESNNVATSLPELSKAFEKIFENRNFIDIPESAERNNLKVTIKSFSYKYGIPIDATGNGGGFVFDCRSLNNPGRYDEYKILTGMDKNVIEFLENKSRVKEFLDDVKALIIPAIENYNERKFTNLSISFGCTGGRHRSVYCADNLSQHLKKKFKEIDIEINHTELSMKNHL